MARIERESKRGKRQIADLLVLPIQRRACKMAQGLVKKLDQTGPAERKGWPQCHKVFSTQGARAAVTKKKRNRTIRPDHQIVT